MGSRRLEGRGANVHFLDRLHQFVPRSRQLKAPPSSHQFSSPSPPKALEIRTNIGIPKIPPESDYQEKQKFFGVPGIARKLQGVPGMPKHSQGFPGSPRDSQKSSQEVPWIPRKSRYQGLPGSPRDSQEVPKIPRTSQGVSGIIIGFCIFI